METNLKTTKEVMELLGCKKATFFVHQAKLDIKPHKKGNKNYYDQEQIKTFQGSLDGIHTQSKQSPDIEQTKIDDTQPTPQQNLELLDYLKQEIDQKKQEYEQEKQRIKQESQQEIERTRAELKEVRDGLKEAQNEIQTLSGQVGHWQGMAQAYQEQNQKLLENQQTEPEIVDAEIIPEEIPEKKGWWQKFWEG